MNIALDTNILAYAEGVNGPGSRDVALRLVESLSPESTLIPVQVLGELYNVLVKRARRSPEAAAAALFSWGDVFPLIESSNEVMQAATELSRAHRLGIWDAVILSAAADARCRLLLSEDLQDGFTTRGVTVTNPFGPAPHPFLRAVAGR